MKTIKFREFTTSSGKIVLGGKDAESNEELMKKFMDKSAIVLHTKEPGSPFCVLESNNKKDIEEASVFCAKYSQAWKKAKVKKDIIVDCFSGKDVFKTKDMKLGTFGVKKYRVIKLKKKDIEEFIKKRLSE